MQVRDVFLILFLIVAGLVAVYCDYYQKKSIPEKFTINQETLPSIDSDDLVFDTICIDNKLYDIRYKESTISLLSTDDACQD